MTDLHLELKHIQKSYLRPVLSDVNLDVTNESYVTIVGKSGSGKSTMLNILGLVEGYDGGEYHFNGKKIRNFMDYSRLRRFDQQAHYWSLRPEYHHPGTQGLLCEHTQGHKAHRDSLNLKGGGSPSPSPARLSPKENAQCRKLSSSTLRGARPAAAVR